MKERPVNTICPKCKGSGEYLAEGIRKCFDCDHEWADPETKMAVQADADSASMEELEAASDHLDRLRRGEVRVDKRLDDGPQEVIVPVKEIWKDQEILESEREEALGKEMGEARMKERTLEERAADLKERVARAEAETTRELEEAKALFDSGAMTKEEAQEILADKRLPPGHPSAEEKALREKLWARLMEFAGQENTSEVREAMEEVFQEIMVELFDLYEKKGGGGGEGGETPVPGSVGASGGGGESDGVPERHGGGEDGGGPGVR